MSDASASADLSTRTRGQCRLILASIVLFALVVRLYRLTDAPPGWNQDEAANAWNAWCLLNSGVDQHGQSWPVFYFRALGENRNTLYLYLVIPFQWLFGLNTFSVRMPNLLGGVALTAIGYYIASRVFERRVGLFAAAFLALQPWSVYMSRWGNEGGLTGLLAALPAAMLIWARLLPTSGQYRKEFRPGRALFAGLACGLACYGYFAARLFIPVMLAALATVYARSFWQSFHAERGRRAVFLFGLGFIVLFAPLAYMHVRHPEIMNVRGKSLWAFSPDDPLPRILSVAGERYAHHYQSAFLFHVGDEFEEVWPSGNGVLPWVCAPLMLLGLVWVVVRREWRPGAALVLTWAAVYPAGDVLTSHFTAHAMRAAPGMCIAAILAALGVVGTWRALGRTPLRVSRLALATVAGAFFLFQSAAFLLFLYNGREYDQRARTVFHSDLTEACAWLRPRLGQFASIHITPTDFNLPYIVALCALQTNPREWLAQPRQMFGAHGWDVYSRFGKVHFLYEQTAAQQLAMIRKTEHERPAALIARPDELDLPNPDKVIFDAYGRKQLHVHVIP